MQSIILMIRAVLTRHDASEKNLHPMDISHDIHLRNHNPHIFSCLSPEGVLTRSNSSHSDLYNAHPWGYPEYVLEPILQDGNKLLEWIPSSRKHQYLGSSSLYSGTVGLFRNPHTGNISPQFHLVFDDYFETLHVGDNQEPPVWS